MDIDILFIEAREQIKERIEMLKIQALSKPTKKEYDNKILNEKLLRNYLFNKGYVTNHVLGRTIYTKGFVCVSLDKDIVEVWHDKTNNDKSVFISESLLTGLPITLNYMQNI